MLLRKMIEFDDILYRESATSNRGLKFLAWGEFCLNIYEFMKIQTTYDSLFQVGGAG